MRSTQKSTGKRQRPKDHEAKPKVDRAEPTESSAVERATPITPSPALGSVQSLPSFLATAGQLTLDEQKSVVSQAISLIQEIYVHLPLKRAMHAIDPLQSLRLLQHQLAALSQPMNERRFHNQMIAIFVSLRDLHTNYILPSYFASYVAFLPFYIEEIFEDQNSERCQYVVSKMVEGFSHPTFSPGAVITHWNGIPMDRAVELNADRNAGSNPDARHARGLENMTIRPMAMSLPPDEEWVVISYQSAGADLEIRLAWQVFEPDPTTGSVPTPSDAGGASRIIGMDFLTEAVRRTKVQLFASHIAEQTRKLNAVGGYGRLSEVAGVDFSTTSTMPGIIAFRKVGTPPAAYGYVRIYSFAPLDETQDASVFADAFVEEIIRILALLPPGGLIVDVRGNGGGIITGGERLLQLLTPRRITPERFDFINTPSVQKLVHVFPDLGVWSRSVDQALETAATYSQAFPLTSEQDANSIGQVYQGPVVLITNALIYSTTDIFAAGVQDHKIGPILGTSGNTGAGGANVWDFGSVRQGLPSTFTGLPEGTSMRVAVRRSTRVGDSSGMPLEDLGVIPDKTHKITKDDVFKDNSDLIAHAVELLRSQTAHFLSAEVQVNSGQRQLVIQTEHLNRVDVYWGTRPAISLDVKDGTTTVDLPAQPAAAKKLLLQGFDGEDLVASRTLSL
jgi:Peptidase family S41